VRKRLQFAVLVSLALAGTALAGGCGGSKTAADATAGTAVAVSIEASAYVPADITIKQGQTVTWTNNDSGLHTVSSDNGDFDSGQIPARGKFSFTFTERGTFQYRCQVHPTQYAKITVIR
jgi:plastocyanin